MSIFPHASCPVPVLETERLRLRAHSVDDFEACLTLWSDPDVTRFIGGRPSTREEVWSRILRYAGHWVLLAYGYWVIEDKATGRLVGETGFADFKRAIEPSLDGMPEIGWVLMPSAQGRGYATEAVRAVVSWGDGHFGETATVCLIAPENLPSIRVAEKCGYRPFVTTTYKDGPTQLMRREPPKITPHSAHESAYLHNL